MHEALPLPSLRFIVLLPLLGVVFHVFCGARLGRGAVNAIGPGVVLAAFLLAVSAFF